MKISVPVTWKNIQEGERYDPWFCPVALAIQDFTGRSVDVQIDQAEIEPETWEPTVRLPWCTPLPCSAIDFIRRFDAGLSVEPFTFEIDWEKPS